MGSYAEKHWYNTPTHMFYVTADNGTHLAGMWYNDARKHGVGIIGGMQCAAFSLSNYYRWIDFVIELSDDRKIKTLDYDALF